MKTAEAETEYPNPETESFTNWETDNTEEVDGFEKKAIFRFKGSYLQCSLLTICLFQELQLGFARQLQAVQPDIIHFQEIYSNSAEATRALIQSWLSLGEGDEWLMVLSTWNDTITVSRFPIIGQWDLYGSTSPSGNLALLLDTEEEFGKKMLMVNAHLPCCGNDIGRQAEVDAIMAFIATLVILTYSLSMKTLPS